MAFLLVALSAVPGQVLAVTASPASIAKVITEDNTPTPFGNVAISATTLSFPFETFLGWTVSVPPTRGTVSFASAGSKNTTVTYTCTVPNYVGSDSFTILCQGNYGNDTIPVTVTISQVNDPPTFTLGSGHTTNEDSGAQAVAGFATGFNPGNSYESAQSLSNYTVTTDDGSLFPPYRRSTPREPSPTPRHRTGLGPPRSACGRWTTAARPMGGSTPAAN